MTNAAAMDAAPMSDGMLKRNEAIELSLMGLSNGIELFVGMDASGCDYRIFIGIGASYVVMEYNDSGFV